MNFQPFQLYSETVYIRIILLPLNNYMTFFFEHDYSIIYMGNVVFHRSMVSPSNFSAKLRDEWTIQHQASNWALWTNNESPHLQMEQQTIHLQNQQDLQWEDHIHHLRYNNQYLIATYGFQKLISDDICSSTIICKLYLESIPIRFSNLNYLSFKNVLHLYKNTLLGFKILIQNVECFHIDKDMIGINQMGEVKVWMNTAFYKSQISGSPATEQTMVIDIIKMIDFNTQIRSMPKENPYIGNYILRNKNKITFRQAINELYNFAEKYNEGIIPNKIESKDFKQNSYSQQQRIKSSKIRNKPLSNKIQKDNLNQSNIPIQMITMTDKFNVIKEVSKSKQNIDSDQDTYMIKNKYQLYKNNIKRNQGCKLNRKVYEKLQARFKTQPTFNNNQNQNGKQFKQQNDKNTQRTFIADLKDLGTSKSLLQKEDLGYEPQSNFKHKNKLFYFQGENKYLQNEVDWQIKQDLQAISK